MQTSMDTTPHAIFSFDKNTSTEDWTIINDAVMGGKSSGSFQLNEAGKGVYKGAISLENNGGFSSLRHRFKKIDARTFTKVVLRVKGDGKPYQFRIRANSSDYFSYIGKFETKTEWQTIEIKFNTMYPAFRGRTLDMPNYNGDSIEEIAFLIGNKKKENFRLLLEHITLT